MIVAVSRTRSRNHEGLTGVMWVERMQAIGTNIVDSRWCVSDPLAPSVSPPRGACPSNVKKGEIRTVGAVYDRPIFR